ncbi:L,D-peptidoglycan transpeptidase YkuD (ErfK/YbiS/YcfS/YnhG family) [Rhodobacter aestuarii]|uniref:L,D-peptidoglycan transpeptidase YkuD, ErfK/YbiS/YcfS/YnhG family n=1 Tax=Rhodobacter aestuarii TaxID=453582 RepID=A0A1N7PU85_9RHOB|nr:L,D-transpeptidase family protein [Rhodobacter aestuarii]PTV94165.1 L,D-peptidoglycan transpeptidase YkuD (ErfK/YbiS/YcfS/YnhG family) [Rhodobacter aestuarii]SIT14110.1 L,D-peptidoglycan transpeptidase YkuD, ErfK/YbiS/YcfS/YnhG family [Rhodobacter aestuarii]
MIRLTPSGLIAFGRRYPVQIGRGGLSRTKQEGDGATPVGRLRVVEMLYRASRLPRPTAWARAIGPQDLWCDAPDHPAYNQLVRAPFAASHERMARPDPLYDIVLVSDWNYPQATPGKGSAIFLHQRRRLCYPTAGCIALRRADLIDFAQRLTPGAEIEIPPLACFLLGRNTSGSGAAPRPFDKA